MSDKSIPLDYANSLIFELEKAFWDERGRGARFRMTTVGREYFREKCLPLIQSSELDHVLDTLKGVLQREEIAGDVSYGKEERLLRVRVHGCVHRPVEDKMLDAWCRAVHLCPGQLDCAGDRGKAGPSCRAGGDQGRG